MYHGLLKETKRTGAYVVTPETFEKDLQYLKEKGYTQYKDQKAILVRSILVSLTILFVVYGGLCWLGACGTPYFDAGMDQTALLNGLVEMLAGRVSLVVLAIAVLGEGGNAYSTNEFSAAVDENDYPDRYYQGLGLESGKDFQRYAFDGLSKYRLYIGIYDYTVEKEGQFDQMIQP